MISFFSWGILGKFWNFICSANLTNFSNFQKKKPNFLQHKIGGVKQKKIQKTCR
jgi:hypothetical protein